MTKISGVALVVKVLTVRNRSCALDKELQKDSLDDMKNKRWRCGWRVVDIDAMCMVG